MRLFGAFVRSCVLVSWILATLSSCQGGSFGWIPGFVGSANCNVSSAALANYVACMNLGLNSTSTPFSLTNNQTSITYGTGYFSPPFVLANYGASSFPGMTLNGNNTWTSMESPYNCTVACRAHGMKYTIMIFNTCNCSPYLNGTYYTNVNPPTRYIDAVYNPILINTTCSVQGHGGEFGCYGDNVQQSCGWMTSTYFNYDIAPSLPTNQIYPYGLTSGTAFVDITFASDSTLNYTFQALNYGYLGCFILSSASTSFMPSGFSNNFLTTSQCYTFCSNINMPYAGIAYQRGNL
jgi:hypothetical protein